MKRTYFNLLIIISSALWVSSCDNESSSPEISYDEWTVIGNGLNEDMVYVHWTGGSFAGEAEWWIISLLEKV